MVISTAISIRVLTQKMLRMPPIIKLTRPPIEIMKIILLLKTWRSINTLIWIRNTAEDMNQMIEIMIEVTTEVTIGGSTIVSKVTSMQGLREAIIPIIRESKNRKSPITIITTSNTTSDMTTTSTRGSTSDTNTVAVDGDIYWLERGINFIKQRCDNQNFSSLKLW